MINDLSRRSFIGSVIGLVASHPFFARFAHEPVQEVVPIKYPYKLLYRDSISGFTIQAPPIESIVCQDNLWIAKAVPMHILKPMRVDQLILLDDSNQVITRQLFSGSANLQTGDTLTVQYSCNVDPGLPISNFEQVIYCLKQRQRKDY